MPNPLEQYLSIVGEEIRWRRARPALLAELHTHLLDQRNACLDQGLSEEDAEAEAIRQMGDPVLVGQELNRVHRPKPQWGLLTLTLALAAGGVWLRVALTAGWPVGQMHLMPALLALGVGSAALIGAYFVDCSVLGRYGKEIYWVALGIGVLLYLCSPVLHGRAVYVAPLVQGYPLVYMAWLSAWRQREWRGMLWSLLGLLPVIAVGLWGSYLPQVLILLLTTLVLLIILAALDWFGVGKKGLWAILLPAGLFLFAGAMRILNSDYIRTRLYYGLHPWEDPLGQGYTGAMVQQALSGAKWWGPGDWSLSVPYELAVPQGGGELLLTTVIQKLGWVPFCLILLAFVGLVIGLLVRCLRQQTTLEKLTVLAVVLPLSMQGVTGAMMALGSCLGTVSFPLLTTNVGMIVDLILIGFALSVFRQVQLPWSLRPPAPDKGSCWLQVSREKGKLTIAWQGRANSE